MKKSLAFVLLVLSTGAHSLCAQDTLSNANMLNFPADKYGISIGNSYEFTGIRINFADKNVGRINGLNITLWRNTNENAIVNGISVGVIPTAGTLRFINVGLLGVGTAHDSYGLNLGGFVVGAGGNINGLSVSGLLTMADGDQSDISGIAISGIGLGARKAINGLAIAGLVVGTDGDITGVASSLAYISSGRNFRGIGVTGGYLESDIFKGVALAGFANTNQMHGLSIALYNSTKELHGIQLGLLNYAGNNREWLRMLPFINLNLSKTQE